MFCGIVFNKFDNFLFKFDLHYKFRKMGLLKTEVTPKTLHGNGLNLILICFVKSNFSAIDHNDKKTTKILLESSEINNYDFKFIKVSHKFKQF